MPFGSVEGAPEEKEFLPIEDRFKNHPITSAPAGRSILRKRGNFYV
jgi:hypothetical protein